MTRVIDRNGYATVYEYDANGNRTAVRYANGLTVSYEYDKLNRLICEETVDSDSNIVVKYVYTLGASGERIKVEELDRTVEYTYDELYRLTSETITEGKKVTTYTYAYDSVSNRTLKTVNGDETVYTYNSLNQLISENDTTYEYDNAGNLVRVIGSGKSALYEYNSENKLVKATVQQGNNVVVEEYTYDYEGNRTSKTTTTSDGNVEYIQYLNDNSSLTNVLVEIGSENVYYTVGADLISQEVDGEVYVYLYDGHGTVRALANEKGEITDTYSYDAFGNLISSTGSTANSYLYCGEQYDSTTGLYYLRARYMDTSTGRFISQDTYAGTISDPTSLHKYLYANSNPVMYTDPSGYMSLLGEIAVTACIDVLISGFISGSVSMGLSIISAFTAAKNAKQDFSLGSEQIMAFIEGFLVGSLLGGIGMLAYSLKLGIVFLAFGIAGIASFSASLKEGVDAWENDDYLLSLAYFGLAGVSLWGANKCFNSAVTVSESKPIAPKGNDYKFQNDKKFNNHYNKHVKKQNEFGDITPEEYLLKCNKFINSGADTKLIKTATNDDTLMYDVFTDEFCIVTKDGIIRTYYKLDPNYHGYDTNLDYWNSSECNY